jgi:hypothetical protein
MHPAQPASRVSAGRAVSRPALSPKNNTGAFTCAHSPFRRHSAAENLRYRFAAEVKAAGAPGSFIGGREKPVPPRNPPCRRRDAAVPHGAGPPRPPSASRSRMVPALAVTAPAWPHPSSGQADSDCVVSLARLARRTRSWWRHVPAAPEVRGLSHVPGRSRTHRFVSANTFWSPNWASGRASMERHDTG